MRHLIGLILAGTIVFGILDREALADHPKNRGLLDPRVYASLFLGTTYEFGDETHNMHWIPFQAGVVLLNTQRLQFLKISYAALVAAWDDRNGKASDAHNVLVFSPVLFKVGNDHGDLYSTDGNGRDVSFVFDIGVDTHGRLVTGLGITF